MESCEELIPILEKTATATKNPLVYHNCGVLYHELCKYHKRDELFHYSLNANFIPTILFLANEKESFQLNLKAATLGSTMAQRQVATVYFEQANYSKAFEWFLSAAMKGNTEAFFKLAICYDLGYGTQLNRAKSWYQQSFHAENPETFEPNLDDSSC